ncbi:MAG TPA: ribosome recycling factor [Candidatus Dormibacteraeota bacterium]|jgi:ribosome recycling factor|nr:ribosome recycling factor [Candidatus Dormibacteraeota bacterium]
MIDDLIHEAEKKMAKSIEVLHHELATVRTGRATPSLLDRIQVDYYGAATPLQQLAQIHAPEARLLLIQPYDRGSIGAIEKALTKSEMNLNPSNDGQVIRIPFAPLTEDRRKELVKVVRHKAEEARVSVRNVRRDEQHGIQLLEKDGDISQDEAKRAMDQLQKVTDRHIEQVEQVAAAKERDLMEV